MKRWIILVCIVVVIGALAYMYLALQRAQAPTPVVADDARVYSVSIDDSYDEGIHTVDGSLALDTPCHTVEAAGRIVGNGIRVDLTVPPLEGVCLQRPSEHTFSVDVEAPEEAVIAVFVNGVAATIE